MKPIAFDGWAHSCKNNKRLNPNTQSFPLPSTRELAGMASHLFLLSCGYSEKLDLILHHELFVGRKSK